MKKFPDSISSNNIEKFPKLKIEYFKELLRSSIYSFLVCRKNEDEEFILENFKKNLTDESIQSVLLELSSYNWNYTLLYGNTVVYIYKDKKPLKCSLLSGNEISF